MKKLLLLLPVLAISLGAFAGPGKKASIGSHISLGPVLSLGGSWIGGDNNIDNKFKFAPAAGIGLVYSTNEHLGFGAQLLVSHEGFKSEEVTTAGTIMRVINPVYLRLPLHLIYFFGKFGDRVRPKIYAGPSIAFKVDETNNYDDLTKSALGSAADVELFKNFDAGLSVGAGANVRLSRAAWLNLDAGYYYGITTAVEGYGYKNRNLRLNLGLMWGL